MIREKFDYSKRQDIENGSLGVITKQGYLADIVYWDFKQPGMGKQESYILCVVHGNGSDADLLYNKDGYCKEAPSQSLYLYDKGFKHMKDILITFLEKFNEISVSEKDRYLNSVIKDIAGEFNREDWIKV